MPKKTTTPKKSRKKAEAKPAGIQPDEGLVPRHEPAEPELKAASESMLQPEPERLPETVSPAVAVEGEALAEAAAVDTFEQAFEEREPPQPREPAGDGSPAMAGGEAPEPAKAEGEDADADHDLGEQVGVEEGEAEFAPQPRPPARLERLQKILSQAGVASRRHAEELITEGRVQVNGKVVTELGSKADAGRDHIRVDGKLLQGAERLRYFVLNKPKGFVTTVSDPEGRPTVMKFFSKMGERLYPVGRLDYQSEGLLLVTNDGDLANKLTKAATGVEKTYLVKVSGRPTAEELDRLREGVRIDRGRPGEGSVPTAPAEIRAGAPRRQSLVRGSADRGTQPRIEKNVRGDRPLRREDPARRVWPAGARRGAGTVPRTGAERTQRAAPGGGRQVAPAQTEGAIAPGSR